jgi:hypothetical protein
MQHAWTMTVVEGVHFLTCRVAVSGSVLLCESLCCCTVLMGPAGTVGWPTSVAAVALRSVDATSIKLPVSVGLKTTITALLWR